MHEWINRELCKRIWFDYVNNYDEDFLENKKNKIIWDFEIHTVHVIQF